MRFKYLALLLVLSLSLAACSTSKVTETVEATEKPSVPTAYPEPVVSTPLPVTPTLEPVAYPEPGSELTPSLPAYPEPGSSASTTTAIPPSGYEPQPGDDKLKRDPVFLDLPNSQITALASTTDQYKVVLQGNMPDPCHSLRVVVTPPDTKNVIQIEAYSLTDPATACITVLDPFTASIPLGNYPQGQYTVMVNGEELGQFGPGYGPQPGDEQLSRGEVFLDMQASQVLSTATQADPVNVSLAGDLPTPCHQLRVIVPAADANNTIDLEVYSVVDSGAMCTDVLQPFQALIPLENVPSGHYTVLVNGEPLGEFDS